MNDKGTFQNNLILLRKQKISHIDALNKISGLNALCRIFNKSILENGDNSKLSNEHYCVRLSMSEIYDEMSKRTQKKYVIYQKGMPQINKDLLRRDIRLLIIAEAIRKVDFSDLTRGNQAIIAAKKKEFNDGKTPNNPYIEAPYYEILDLTNSHLERLTKIKHQKDLSYVIVQQLFGDKIADNCFNNTIRNYKTGLNAFGNDSFKCIIETIQKNKIVALKELSQYCEHNLSLSNGDKKSQAWWSRQLKGFNFKQEGITICRNSELSEEMRLDIHGNSLVLIVS